MSPDRDRLVPSVALRAGLLVAVVGGSWLALATTGGFSVHRAHSLVGGGGAVAPLVFVGASAALTLVSFPGPLLAGAAGLLFGAVEGGLLALGAATIGATAASLVGRQIVDGTIAVPGTRVVRMLKTLRRAPFVAVLYARILPAVPFSLVSYACGILRIPLAAFVGATALGAAPRAFAYAALGGSLGDLSRPTAIAAVAVLVGMALAGAVLARRAW